MKDFGQVLEDLNYHRTVGAGPEYFNPQASPGRKYTFGSFNPAIPFPSSQRYFGLDQEEKGSIAGGETVNLEAINNAIRSGLFPGADLISELDNGAVTQAMNDVRYIWTGSFGKGGVPLTLWNEVLKADERWRAVHEPQPAPTTPPPTPVPVPPPAPAPPVGPDLKLVLKGLRGEIVTRKIVLEGLGLPPAGGGKPAVALRSDIQFLGHLIVEIDEALESEK